jgi:hypothetical protein
MMPPSGTFNAMGLGNVHAGNGMITRLLSPLVSVVQLGSSSVGSHTSFGTQLLAVTQISAP